MTRQSFCASILLLVFALTPGYAQQAVRTGPPPEMRAFLDQFVEAFNSGKAETWDAFVQARFSPELQQKIPAANRAQMYQQLVNDFGTIALGRVQREGPDAPLQMHVKGSKGDGIFIVGVTGDTPRIVSFGVEAGDRGDRAPAAPVAGVPLPQLNGSLASDEIDRRLDGYFSTLAKQDAFSGVALVARNGVPVFMKAYGMADREKKVANTIRTRFNIGSINKEFTQTAIRQLVREGKLSPDDTLGKFFPDYPQAVSKNATVQQLLSHRGGLSDFFGPQFNAAPKDRFASNADYFTFVGGLPANFAPGERNQYCNGCYIALGAIIEKVSGMPYEKYMAEHVYGRAEMTSTGFPRTDRHQPDMAIGYTRREGDETLRPNTALHGVTGSAAGGNYSTVLDLLTYTKAVRAGKFPGNDAGIGIAGGAPGTNAVLESGSEWTVIVLSNFDPPVAERIGVAVSQALSR
jgi:D-alanyl-D-alanine carboxypeptidase